MRQGTLYQAARHREANAGFAPGADVLDNHVDGDVLIGDRGKNAMAYTRLVRDPVQADARLVF